jgi:hypothetical protein
VITDKDVGEEVNRHKTKDMSTIKDGVWIPGGEFFPSPSLLSLSSPSPSSPPRGFPARAYGLPATRPTPPLGRALRRSSGLPRPRPASPSPPRRPAPPLPASPPRPRPCALPAPRPAPPRQAPPLASSAAHARVAPPLPPASPHAPAP